MTSAFLCSFGGIFGAVATVFLISVAAGLLVRHHVITQGHIDALASVTVSVLLPCLIFSKITQNFDPSALRFWWTLPVAGAGMSLGGLVMASALFARDGKAKRPFLAFAAMQNAGYLVLPIGQLAYPDEFDLFATYCFLFILGYSPLLWSLGRFLTTSSHSQVPVWKQFLSPPFFANVLAVTTVLSGGVRFVPPAVRDSIQMLGSATVPVATLILGATLGSIHLGRWPPWTDTVRALLVKFFLLPVLTILLLKWLELPTAHPLLSDVLILEASSAPATALILQVRKYGGDIETAGAVLLTSYLVCMAALPFWLAVSHVL